MALKDEPGEVEDATPHEPTGNGAENLLDLAREADLLDTAPEAAAQAGMVAQAEAVESNNAAELLMVFGAIRSMALPMLAMVHEREQVEAVAQVWNDGVLGQASNAGGAIMALQGWDMGTAAGKYAPYVMLAMALIPPVLMTKKILSAPKPAQDKPAAPAPGPVGG